MAGVVGLLSTNWRFEPGAPASDVERMERELGVVFPDDYSSLLMRSNGGDVCYALRYGQSDSPSLVRVPLGDLDDASAEVVGVTLVEGLEHPRIPCGP